MTKSEKNVLDYVLRKSMTTGEIQEPVADIAKALGHSTSTVWRALKSLEEAGAIEIEKTSSNKKANIVRPTAGSEKQLKDYEKWITEAEELVDLTEDALSNFRKNKEMVQNLERQLELYREQQQRVVKTIEMSNGYELVIKRTSDKEPEEDKNVDSITASVLVEALTQNSEHVISQKN